MLCQGDISKYEVIGWLPIHISLKSAVMKSSAEEAPAFG